MDTGERRQEYFPDGTPIDDWFYDTSVPEPAELGRPYVLTDYDIWDDGKIYTKQIQRVIDLAAGEGGGVLVVPAGTYRTGALHFRQGVHLYVSAGGTLKGSDDISDYDLCETRIEGETCLYFDALINAEGVDGFTMCGPGTIDGNGLRAWRCCWLRWKWGGGGNKEEQRPRLVYLSHCRNVRIADLRLQNSPFWTTHIYKCDHVKYLRCRIYSPAEPVPAPSTDAIDIDACTDVLIKDCCMEVNDDAVVLKGGKGPWADTQPENGANERILVEDCVYGFCHGCLTCGSESVHNRNILMRRVKVGGAARLLWLKMRPDTPQRYEYITVEQIEGRAEKMLTIYPWTQFFDLKDRRDPPLSYAEHITVRDCRFTCDTFFDVLPDEEQYILSDFTLQNLSVKARDGHYAADMVRGLTAENVQITCSEEDAGRWHTVHGFQ